MWQYSVASWRNRVRVVARLAPCLAAAAATSGFAGIECTCDDLPLAFPSGHEIRMEGEVKACALAGAADACLELTPPLLDDPSNCQVSVVDAQSPLGACGGEGEAGKTFSRSASDESDCAEARANATSITSMLGAATGTSLAASIVAITSISTRAAITSDECCEGAPPGAHACATAQALLRTTDPLTVTIEFDVCKSIDVNVDVALIPGYSCAEDPFSEIPPVSASWTVLQGGTTVASGSTLSMDSENFELNPGTYSFNVALHMNLNAINDLQQCEPELEYVQCLRTIELTGSLEVIDP
jgi:hypothetical protein